MDQLPKPKWNKVSLKRVWRALGWIVITLTVVAFWYDFYLWNLSGGSDFDTALLGEESYDDYSYDDCDIAGINLHGDLYTYVISDPETGSIGDVVGSEDVVYSIKAAEDNPDVKAILVEVDSYGGYPVAAEEIATALKSVTKPTVVQIRQAGLSAAYWAATGADTIFASELSDIGSIGVTQSYVDASGYNQKEGYIYNSLSTGKYKDMLDPEKPLTAEERALLERDLQIVHEAFVKAVSENRGLSISRVRALADGSSMPGKMALENGLIDRIGGFSEVEEYLKELIDKEPVICW